MKHFEKQDLEDYPAAALWYVLAAGVSLGAAVVAIAVTWGHSISNTIVHATM